MTEVYEGEVKWFSNERGYGFICPDDAPETEYFVHFSSIMVDGFKTLQTKQKVNFELRETPKGVQAVEVRPL
jgi:CspA family cold shock protein